MHRLLGSLVGRPVVRLPLRALTSAAVVGLAAGSSWDPGRLHALTGGNPFYVTEALAEPGNRLQLFEDRPVANDAWDVDLLIGAGLFVRSLQNLKSLDPGFAREGVLLVNVNPQQSGYKGQRLRNFYERLLLGVHALPGVRVASLAEITPLAGWSTEQVWDYVHKHRIPYNPLTERGFRSIGCLPCTRPVGAHEDERAGRWTGFEKTECGLHTFMGTHV